MPAPSISVVMPVHNGLPHLDQAIESIVDQTFPDFELVILNDGSTDGTGRLLREWQCKDARIRTFESQRNLGVVGSSNFVVSQARAELVARMDADDIARPDRLRRQWEIVSKDPNVHMVGTLWEGIDARGCLVRPRDRWRCLRRSAFAPFPHGSIMFRKTAFERAGGYRQCCRYWEDHDLYWRMEAAGKIVVIPDALYLYRFHGQSARAATNHRELIEATALMHRCLAERRAGRDYTCLIAEAFKYPGPRRLPPAVFTSVGSSQLWSGHSPEILFELLRRGRLGFDSSTAMNLAWAALGSLSPPALRASIRGMVRFRDALAGPLLDKKSVLEWRFH